MEVVTTKNHDHRKYEGLYDSFLAVQQQCGSGDNKNHDHRKYEGLIPFVPCSSNAEVVTTKNHDHRKYEDRFFSCGALVAAAHNDMAKFSNHSVEQ